MSSDHNRQHEPRERLPEPDTSPTAAESVEKVEDPQAVQAAKPTDRRGISRDATAQDTGRRSRGGEWVRRKAMLNRRGGAWAGRGMDFAVQLSPTARATKAPLP